MTGLVWFLVFIFSTTLHEAAHAWTSHRLGDSTAYLGGQVSLDPLSHIRREPIGMLVIPIVSYVLSGWMIGWASAPYNFLWAVKYPKRSAMMSLAGPLANFALCIFSLIVIKMGLSLGWFLPPETIGFSKVVESTGGIYQTLGLFLSITFMLNLLLGIFNLFPLPPLDGSGVITWFLNSEQTLKYYNFIHQSSISFIGIIIAWNLFDKVFDPVFDFVISNILYPNLTYYTL